MMVMGVIVLVGLLEGRSNASAASCMVGTTGAAALAAGITLWVLDGQSTVENDAGTKSLTTANTGTPFGSQRFPK